MGVQSIECTPARVNLNVNYGLGVIMLYKVSVGSSIVANVSLWWGVLMVGEAEGGREQEVYGKSPYSPLNFAMKLKMP